MQTAFVTYDGKIYTTREQAELWEAEQFKEWLESKPFVDIQYVLAQLSQFSPSDWDGCTYSEHEMFRRLLFHAFLSGKIGVHSA